MKKNKINPSSQWPYPYGKCHISSMNSTLDFTGQPILMLTANTVERNRKSVIEIWGKCNNQIVKIVVDYFKPLFFVEREAGRNLNLRFHERKKVELKNPGNELVDALYFENWTDLQKAKAELETNGVRTYESDIRPHERYLMEHFIHLEFEVIGGEVSEIESSYQIKNPRIKPAMKKPNNSLSVLSLDIETGQNGELYSIGLHQRSGDENIEKVFMVGNVNDSVDYVFFKKTESELLDCLDSFLERYNPDIIVGWHVIGFDFDFLRKKYAKYGKKFCMGRDNSETQIISSDNRNFRMSVPGRIILDIPSLLRRSFFKFENFKLDTVASEVLGVGKDIEQSGYEKVEEIERRFREDKLALAKYNLLDCTLVLDVIKKLSLMDLTLERSRISGLTIEKIGLSSAAFDYIYLPRFHRCGFVAPNTRDVVRESSAGGGHVLEPEAGLHKNVLILDFKSLYPTIISTFKIDPLARMKGREVSETFGTPAGLNMAREHHILPEIIEGLLEKRRIAKFENNEALSMAVKILMNSFYGVMGSPGSRFYHADLPETITNTGRWVLQRTISILEDMGYKVIYGDTDSVFVSMDGRIKEDWKIEADALAAKVNMDLSKVLSQKFGVVSRLVLEPEKLFKKIFFPQMRSGNMGAKKRYVGFVSENEIEFKGMEFVRSDATRLAKYFQIQLYKKVFENVEVEDWIREFVQNLKNGKYDEKLVYTKRLSKKISEYEKSQPPHVKAAKLLPKEVQNKIRSISYYMTFHGPVPIELKPNDIDYDHYVEKQLKPLADDILPYYSTSFENIVGGDQLSLF